MVTKLAATLGPLQAKIYWLHDAEKFDELAVTVGTLYQLLGHQDAVCHQVGPLISEAYELADKAEPLRYADREKELKYYAEAQTNLEAAAHLLGFPQETAAHQVQWWMYFRHRQILKALWHLFRQHYRPFGLVYTFSVIQITYFLIQVGFGHNQRNLANCERNAIQYWDVLLRLNQRGCPYLG